MISCISSQSCSCYFPSRQELPLCTTIFKLSWQSLFLIWTLSISVSGIARSSPENLNTYAFYVQARSEHDAKCTPCIPNCRQGGRKFGLTWQLECNRTCKTRCKERKIGINQRFQTLESKVPSECKMRPSDLEHLQKLQDQWLDELRVCKQSKLGHREPGRCNRKHEIKKATLPTLIFKIWKLQKCMCRHWGVGDYN
jgi:hypothetical protein